MLDHAAGSVMKLWPCEGRRSSVIHGKREMHGERQNVETANEQSDGFKEQMPREVGLADVDTTVVVVSEGS